MTRQQIIEIEVLYRFGIVKKRPLEVRAWLIYERMSKPYDSSLEDEIKAAIGRLMFSGRLSMCYGDAKGGYGLTPAGERAAKLDGKREERRKGKDRRNR